MLTQIRRWETLWAEGTVYAKAQSLESIRNVLKWLAGVLGVRVSF